MSGPWNGTWGEMRWPFRRCKHERTVPEFGGTVTPHGILIVLDRCLDCNVRVVRESEVELPPRRSEPLS